MLIEAFSEAKDPSAPDANEDRLVILPGRAYAVIDGVTDRLGTRLDGMLLGQYAAMVVQGALEHMLGAPDGPTDGLAVVRTLTERLAGVYRKQGIFEAAQGDCNLRLSAALALVLVQEETLDVVLVGDSGVRINGDRIIQMEKDLDRITATLRREAWPVIGEKTRDPVMRERMSRRITWHGTRQPADALPEALTPDDLLHIEERAVAVNVRALPHVPRRDIENLVRGGIVNAQGGYQNDASTALGYACLDGFAVPEALILIEHLPRKDVRTVEIFSDGYFKPGKGFGVAAWEKAFAEVEQEDPAKVVLYASPKGSIGSIRADDRTYLGVRFA